MNLAPSPRPVIGIALVIGSCLALPFGAAFAAQLFPTLGPWGVTALRVSIAALVVMVAVRPRPHGWDRRQWTAAVLFGISLACMNGFFYAAIDRIPLGPAVAIEFIGPLVLAAVLTRRVVDAAWVGLALLGVALLGADALVGADPLDPLGVLFVLIAAASWAAYIRMSSRVGTLIPGHGGLAVALAVAAVLLLPFGVPAAGAVAGDPRLLPLAALTAVLSSVIPYTFEFAALRRIPQRVFGILLSLEPVFATLAGFLLLGQQATPLRMLAIGCVVVASVGTALAIRRRGPGRGRGIEDGSGDGPEPSVLTGSSPVVPN